MDDEVSKKDKKFYITMIISIIIMFGFGYLPPFGEVTPMGMRALGILVGCVFAWCLGELVCSSILGLIILSLYNLGTMSVNYATAYGGMVAAITITVFIFCFAIERSGLLREVSLWILGQKWAQKSPWMLVMAFYLAAVVGSFLTANPLAPLLLLWSLFYQMAKELDLKPYDMLSSIILVGIGVFTYVGATLVPYSSMPTIIRGLAVTIDPAFEFNMAMYMFLNLIFTILAVLLVVGVLRLLIGPKLNFKMQQKEAYKMQLNGTMKWVICYVAILVGAMLASNILPKGNFIRVMFGDKLGVVGTAMLLSVLMMITRVEHKPILDIIEGLKNVPWTIVLMVTSALTISDYLTKNEAGVLTTIVAVIEPLVAGKSSLIIILIFMAIGMLMTNMLNDIVTLVVLYPIAVQFIASSGGSVMLFTLLFSQMTVQGCFLPSGSATGALFHGNAEWLRSKDVFKYVAIIECVLLIAGCLVVLIGRQIGI